MTEFPIAPWSGVASWSGGKDPARQLGSAVLLQAVRNMREYKRPLDCEPWRWLNSTAAGRLFDGLDIDQAAALEALKERFEVVEVA